MEPAELLRAVRAVIAGNPGRHDQSSWVCNVFDEEMDAQDVAVLRRFADAPVPGSPQDPGNPVCGTTGCVAGWAVILGSEPGTLVAGYEVTLPSGAAHRVAWLAQELLGLTEYQGIWLFSGGRTRDEVLWALDLLVSEPDADLPGRACREFTEGQEDE